MLSLLRAISPTDDEDSGAVEATIEFCDAHGQSLDLIVAGRGLPTTRSVSARLRHQSSFAVQTVTTVTKHSCWAPPRRGLRGSARDGAIASPHIRSLRHHCDGKEMTGCPHQTALRSSVRTRPSMSLGNPCGGRRAAAGAHSTRLEAVLKVGLHELDLLPLPIRNLGERLLG